MKSKNKDKKEKVKEKKEELYMTRKKKDTR